MKKRRLHFLVPMLVMSAAALGACQNSPSKASMGKLQGVVTVPSPGVGAPKFVIDSVRSTPGVDPDDSWMLTLNFPNGGLDVHCSEPGSCICEFTWSEANITSTETIRVPRKVQTVVEDAKGTEVFCSAPGAYNDEIDPATSISVAVYGIGANAGSFRVDSKSFTKNEPDIGSPSDMRDGAGNIFRPISRYTCFEQFRRGTKITNRVGLDPTNGIRLMFANEFCFNTSDGKSVCDTSSKAPDDSLYSSQSYSYHLYFMLKDVGQLSIGGVEDNLVCPKVSVNGAIPSFHPMDTTFALATQPNSTFAVGVDAPSKLLSQNTGGDQVNSGSTCAAILNKTAPSGTESMGFRLACMGFAARPQPDGTCQALPPARAGEAPISTYRLRRYFTTYPVRSDTNGMISKNEAPRVDMVYVIDRPVKAGADAATMRGPLPCPFALPDVADVTRTVAEKNANMVYSGRYVATNNASWRGKNIDGIELPNTDTAHVSTTPGSGSCAAALPLYKWETRTWSVGTIHSSNRSPAMKSVPIRPIEPWTAEYREDTSFQACAPLPPAAQIKEAPLQVLAEGDGVGGTKAAWCVKTLPNHSSMAEEYARNYLGRSHSFDTIAGISGRVKRSITATSEQLAVARDRTKARGTFKRYNLVAPDQDIIRALRTQPQYRCAVTSVPAGVTAPKIPSTGCCHTTTSGSAHVENSADCEVPTL